MDIDEDLVRVYSQLCVSLKVEPMSTVHGHNQVSTVHGIGLGQQFRPDLIQRRAHDVSLPVIMPQIPDKLTLTLSLTGLGCLILEHSGAYSL